MRDKFREFFLAILSMFASCGSKYEDSARTASTKSAISKGDLDDPTLSGKKSADNSEE